MRRKRIDKINRALRNRPTELNKIKDLDEADLCALCGPKEAPEATQSGRVPKPPFLSSMDSKEAGNLLSDGTDS